MRRKRIERISCGGNYPAGGRGCCTAREWLVGKVGAVMQGEEGTGGGASGEPPGSTAEVGGRGTHAGHSPQT